MDLRLLLQRSMPVLQLTPPPLNTPPSAPSSELIIGKEPTFTESVYSKLAGAYATGAASVSSVASVASATAASAVGGATDAAESAASVVSDTVASMTDKVKETVDSIKDEL